MVAQCRQSQGLNILSIHPYCVPIAVTENPPDPLLKKGEHLSRTRYISLVVCRCLLGSPLWEKGGQGGFNKIIYKNI